MSIGARLGGAPKTDAFAFETQPPRIIQKGRIATLKLISVTRKSTFGYTPPADPGSFLLYINGVGVGIPDVPALPLTGGTAALNMCKTINMDGSDRVQVIFTNALGGTTWSQFGRADNFGVGKAHTMTTGRSVVVPGHPSPGNMHPKPETLRLNEFELTYTIEHSNPLGQVGPLNAQAQVLSNGPTDPAPTPTPMPAAGSIRAQQHWNGAAKLSEAVPVPCRQL